MASAGMRALRLRRAGRDAVLDRRAVLMGMAAGLLVGAPARAATRGRVVVIGAGFGGLACAYELRAAGFDVVVVEARDRVGGRVFSRRDIAPGANVEFGGELIGANHPTWLAYAQRFGLTFRDVSEDADLDVPILVDGRVLSPAEVAALDEGTGLIEEALTTAASGIDPLTPWTAPDAARLDAMSIERFVATTVDKGAGPLARRCFDLETAHNNAAPCAAQSLLANLAMIRAHGGVDYWTQTEVYRCAQGNQALALKLAEGVGLERIRLRTQVRGVVARGVGVRVVLANGRALDADVAVLAVPPSVWPSLRLDPAPPSPPRMGWAVKHFTPLTSKVWAEEGLSQYALTEDCPGMTWDGLDGQGRKDAVLVGFTGGAMAAEMSTAGRSARDRRVAATYARVYPGLAASARPLFANWPADPYTRAGYSFPAPGWLTADRGALRAGLPHLQIAGEHASIGFAGYMEGALESGVAAARRIAAA